jgi:hypothetical protein
MTRTASQLEFRGWRAEALVGPLRRRPRSADRTLAQVCKHLFSRPPGKRITAKLSQSGTGITRLSRLHDAHDVRRDRIPPSGVTVAKNPEL